LIEVGRVYVKIAGREAGLKAVIVEKIDDTFVLIDGEVKRRRCNVRHLVPLNFKLDIKPKAKTEDVKEALKKADLLKAPVPKTAKKKEKKKEKGERPRKKHVVKKSPEEQPKKAAKKPTKKAAKKPTKKAAKKPTKKAAKKPTKKK